MVDVMSSCSRERPRLLWLLIDQYQGQGIGSILMRHLAAIARAAGLQELIAEVLPENVPMLESV